MSSLASCFVEHLVGDSKTDIHQPFLPVAAGTSSSFATVTHSSTQVMLSWQLLDWLAPTTLELERVLAVGRTTDFAFQSSFLIRPEELAQTCSCSWQSLFLRRRFCFRDTGRTLCMYTCEFHVATRKCQSPNHWWLSWACFHFTKNCSLLWAI